MWSSSATSSTWPRRCAARPWTRQQHFTLDLPSAPIEVFADAARLLQVFCNPLDNASKFTPAGGHIALRVALQEQSVAVTVSDTGVGITPANFPAISDMFHVPGGTPAGRADRPGVGLTVVSELVAAHAGTVSGSSAGNGRGSRCSHRPGYAPGSHRVGRCERGAAG